MIAFILVRITILDYFLKAQFLILCRLSCLFGHSFDGEL